MNFTFRQIRYFVAVADSFSVSRAAAELHISQSAVTSAIRELETELGAALFERNPRGVSLTTQGHQFLLHARRILSAMTEASYSLKAVAQQDQGWLTIGVTTLVAGYYLSEALGRFRRAFPAVQIEVKEDEQPYLEHQIVNGEVDVGILMTNRTIRQEAFDTELLTRSPLRVWLAANHPLCAESTLSLKALGEEPMISLTADQLDQIIGGGLRRYGISPRIVLRTASVEAVRSLVASQLGLALLPDFAYRPWSLVPGPWSRSGSRPAPSRSPFPPSTSAWCGDVARAWTGPHASSSTSPEIRAGYGPASTSPARTEPEQP